MTAGEPVRVVQYYSARKQAEFAGMGPAERLAWLDEIRELCAFAAAARAAGAASLVSDGKAAPAAFARVAHVGGLEDLDEGEELRRYRNGCLALSPDERVAEARRLSRRVRLANPRNPRSARIEPVVRLAHDAL